MEDASGEVEGGRGRHSYLEDKGKKIKGLKEVEKAAVLTRGRRGKKTDGCGGVETVRGKRGREEEGGGWINDMIHGNIE